MSAAAAAGAAAACAAVSAAAGMHSAPDQREWADMHFVPLAPARLDDRGWVGLVLPLEQWLDAIAALEHDGCPAIAANLRGQLAAQRIYDRRSGHDRRVDPARWGGHRRGDRRSAS